MKTMGATFKDIGRRFSVAASVIAGSIALLGCMATPGPSGQSSVESTTIAFQEEYCLPSAAVSTFFGGRLNTLTSPFVDLWNNRLSEAEKAKSLYCHQNLGGVVLVTNQVMDTALLEAGQGILLASQALELNVASQQATLARIARLQNLSLGEKLEPEYQEELRLLNVEIADLAKATEQKLAELSASNGITREAEDKLLEAYQHFVNFHYAQGKAAAGFTLFELARQKYGTEIIAQAFVEAIRIDHSTRGDFDLEATGNLAKAFLGAIPKFGETVNSGERLSSAIGNASDTTHFKRAVRRMTTPEPQQAEWLVEFASDVERTAAGLPLPMTSDLTSI